MDIFYHSKVKFTMVNTILSVTAFFHLIMVNVHLVCHDRNGGRMKVKFTMVNRPEKHSLSCVYLNFVDLSDSLSTFLI